MKDYLVFHTKEKIIKFMKELDSDKSLGLKENGEHTFKTTSIESITECSFEVVMKLIEESVSFLYDDMDQIYINVPDEQEEKF